MARNRDPEPELDSTSAEHEEEESETESESMSEPNPTQYSVAPALPPKGGAESSKTHDEADSSSEENDSGSDSESEESRPETPPKPVVPVPKPVSKKKGMPAAQASLPGTPVSASKASGSKRVAETKGLGDKDSKKAKKKKNDTSLESDGGDDSKKPSFQRIWNDDDELVVLRGMIEYMDEKKIDPNSDLSSFHDFIKDKLQAKVTKEQLRTKVRRLKKKFADTESKGVDTLSKPHEHVSYQLSKTVWGSKNVERPVAAATNSNVSKKAKPNKDDSVPEQGKLAVANGEVHKTAGVDSPGNPSLVSHPLSNLSSISGGFVNMEEMFDKVGMEIFQGGKVVGGAKDWMDLRLEEMELFSKTLSAKAAKARLVMDALKSRQA